MGKLVRAIAELGGAVCFCVDATDIVKRAQFIHQTSPVASAALGRLLAAGSMMGSMLKGRDDSVTLRISGKGQIGSVIVVSDSSGMVKGYVTNPQVDLPLNSYGKLDVSGAVGKEGGTLHVIKDLGMKEPYIGMIPLVSGEIAEDITEYFAVSEQIPTVCALGVLVSPDGEVVAAGGYIVQMLPGATDEEISVVEKNIKAMPSVTSMLSSSMQP